MSDISYCVGYRHFSKTINETHTEKIYPKTKKKITTMRGKYAICGRNKSKILNKHMSRGENFRKRGKCENGHCTSMSNSA